jgi:hypothetical protein
VSFDIRNRSAGNGSIDEPNLILKFTNDAFRHKIAPRELYPDRTIFLEGGGSKKISLDYDIYNFDEDLLKHLQEHSEKLEYYIEYSDNLGEHHLLKIHTFKKNGRS